MSKVVFSGIQPSGNLHIGNYIGALTQWVKMQEGSECIFCIVDLHAITVPQDPKILKEKVKEVAAIYLSAGIDPKKSHIFVQSQNPDHPYLAWILNTILPMGWLNRMTQYKDKAIKAKNLLDLPKVTEEMFEAQNASVGLFDYPALMAADILLYDTDEVPVGEDQKQHIELTRDVAEKFNKTFGETFKLPNPQIQKETARIMSMQNPDNKMSKSDIDPLGTINILDTEEQIREKVKKAVTDSGSKVGEQGSAAITNLLTIYSAFKDISFDESLKENEGKSYMEFKTNLADLMVSKLSPIRQKYEEIRKDDKYLNQILSEGLGFALGKSNQKISDVRQKVGLS